MTRLKRTWGELEEVDPKLVQYFRTELTEISDPGSGIYSKMMDRVSGEALCVCVCVWGGCVCVFVLGHTLLFLTFD